MKRLLTALAALLVALLVSAQVVTTTPAFITKGYGGQIIVTFDPSQGNKGMVNATQCYAHTGLLTSESSSNKDWKYVTDSWRGGAAKNKMTKVGSTWQLVIGNMYSFYGCPTTTDITHLAFVFNDGPNGSKEGKGADGGDVLIPLYNSGLNVAFMLPKSDVLIDSDSVVQFKGKASVAGSLSLTINNVLKSSVTNGDSLVYSHAFLSSGDNLCVLSLSANGQTVSDTLRVCVAKASEQQPRPNGIDEGIYYDATDSSRVTLSMYAASKSAAARNVYVVGDFNNWIISNSYQLKQDSNFFWITLTGLTPGKEYAYQYVVTRSDGVVKRISDAYSTKVLYPDDQYQPAQLDSALMPYPTDKGDGYVSVLQTAKPAFPWSSATLNFVRPPKNNLIIYELWLYDYSAQRSIQGLVERLDYLKNLGVNAIELMPICEFEGNYSWGYNPTHYFAPDKAYGSEQDYKMLIDECHQRGMAVILDMVFNHATGLNPQNKLYPYGADLSQNPWFNVTAPHSDNVFEDWNHDFSETRKLFTNVLKYWLTEYKVDGFRMDLAHGFMGADYDAADAAQNITYYYQQGVQATSADAYFILEYWNGGKESQLINSGMMCWANNTNAYQQTAMGWLKDNDGFSLSNRDNYVSYCESHDEERCFYKAKRWGNGSVVSNQQDRLERVPLNIAFNVLLNGPHLLWQFEELGYDYSINSNEQGVDQSSSDYRTHTKPQPSGLGWFTDSLRMQQYVKTAQVIYLRTYLADSIFAGNPTSVSVNSGSSLRTVSWGSGVNAIYVMGNFNVDGGTEYSGTVTGTLPQGSGWYDYLGGGLTPLQGGVAVTLQPGELKIFTARRFDLPVLPDDYDFATGVTESVKTPNAICSIYPTLATDVVRVVAETEPYSIQVYGLNGGLCREVHHDYEVNVSSLEPGLYLMVVTLGDRQQAFKFIKQ